MSSKLDDPISRIEWVEGSRISANSWNPNHVAVPELKLLETSILLTGWVQPILVARREVPDSEGAEFMIIDGFHRWKLSQVSPHLQERYAGQVPCAVLDMDEESAMLLTVRINRAKGTHGSVAMSSLVRSLLERGVTSDRIALEMGATQAEVDLLSQEDVFKVRKIAGWSYSPSWVPIENGLSAQESHAEREEAKAAAKAARR